LDRVGLPGISAGSYWDVGTEGAGAPELSAGAVVVVSLPVVAGAVVPESVPVAGAVVVGAGVVPLR
jgi:hypothetical protein